MGSQVVTSELSRTCSFVGAQRNITSADMGLDLKRTCSLVGVQRNITSAAMVLGLQRTCSFVGVQTNLTSADMGLVLDCAAEEAHKPTEAEIEEALKVFSTFYEWPRRRRVSTRGLEREKEVDRTCDRELRKHRKRDLPEALDDQDEKNDNEGLKKRCPAVVCEVVDDAAEVTVPSSTFTTVTSFEVVDNPEEVQRKADQHAPEEAHMPSEEEIEEAFKVFCTYYQ